MAETRQATINPRLEPYAPTRSLEDNLRKVIDYLRRQQVFYECCGGPVPPPGGRRPVLNATLPAENTARDSWDIGRFALYSGPDTPEGWLECEGQAVNRRTYASIFGVIGTQFGAGDGTTTFNLPDFRGRVAVGAGTGDGLSHRALGEEFGSEGD